MSMSEPTEFYEPAQCEDGGWTIRIHGSMRSLARVIYTSMTGEDGRAWAQQCADEANARRASMKDPANG